MVENHHVAVAAVVLLVVLLVVVVVRTDLALLNVRVAPPPLPFPSNAAG